MTKLSDITPELLRQLLDYDPETGVLTWKWRDRSWFDSDRIWKIFNSQFAGKQALNCLNNNGYCRGAVLRVNVLAHRVCWAIYHGVWPCEEIDHINGNPIDNRIVNLRAVSRSENARNHKMHVANKSGFTGVRFDSRRDKFVARVGLNGQTHHIGMFKTQEDAELARTKANKKYGFHENHGKR